MDLWRSQGDKASGRRWGILDAAIDGRWLGRCQFGDFEIGNRVRGDDTGTSEGAASLKTSHSVARGSGHAIQA